ncbi:hypothetical protein [Taibaiella soli]|uniref:Uncharacterized protein n=1 Tax=Taibaiella soli TaxID=1649169 RepID=A0A2W2AFX8_9BACT|nr:hypothetical protein [Taibaiella soli]PZF74211.1 hypothetical protein DN068_04120 [Taibaiella soli]
MNIHNDIVEELSAWNSPLAGMSRKMPYEIPDGYFEALSDRIIAIQAIENGLLPQVANPPFAVPQDYFEKNPEVIMNRIEAEMLAGFPKSNPFTVPGNYFENLSANIMAAVENEADHEPVEYKPIRKRKINFWGSIRWAAAAILISSIGIGSYKMIYPVSPSAEHRMSRISTDTIGAFVQANLDEFDADMLENNVATAKTVRQDEYHSQINKIDKNEIIQYLNETGWSEKNETN